jgi:hypothetical protein
MLRLTLTRPWPAPSTNCSVSPEELTRLALSPSLWPLHNTDYANCLDDSVHGCEAIGLIHPSHDT